MREEIWTEKIFKDDAGYFLRITYIVLYGRCKSRHEEVNGRHNFVTVIRKKVAMQQIFKQLQQISFFVCGESVEIVPVAF